MSAETAKSNEDELSVPLEAPDELPIEWKSAPFPTCLAPTAARPAKLLARDYKPAGRFPVIDQGQSEIAGWCDDESLVIADGLPYIVFGDHTRAFKFASKPFVLGADGTQMLKPSSEFNPHFFFYACQHLDLPNRGYNRHFSLLKERSLVRPPKSEQEKIAAVLWRAQRAVEVEGKLVRTARELKVATLSHLFTYGLRGEATKETDLGPLPESWEPCSIGDLGEVVTGTTPKTAQREYYDGGTIDFLAPGDLGGATQVTHAAKKITEAGLAVCRALPKDTTLFVCIGSTIGKVGITARGPCATNQQINAVIAGPDFDPHFICYLLERHSEHIASRSSPSPVPIMSKAIFSGIQLYVSPDKDEQREIASNLAAVDAKIALHERKRETLRALFRTLLRDLLTARRRVHELPIDVSEVTAA